MDRRIKSKDWRSSLHCKKCKQVLVHFAFTKLTIVQNYKIKGNYWSKRSYRIYQAKGDSNVLGWLSNDRSPIKRWQNPTRTQAGNKRLGKKKHDWNRDSRVNTRINYYTNFN